jgi:hypothetical protein
MISLGEVLKPTITVVLNVYKRSSIFEEQLNAIRAQTIKPLEILVWEDGHEKVPVSLRDGLKIAGANHNYGVWARFAYALNGTGKFIFIIDDDTIPGRRWLENCIETMNKTPGLLGARGLIFDNKHSYSMNHDVGIYCPNENTTAVDIVGHSWFFKREWLYAFWGCADLKFENNLAGEDIHFSFAMQKFLGIPTLVPRHPINDTSLWGADPELSKSYGSGREGISNSPNSIKKFEEALRHYRNHGFKTLSEIEPKTVDQYGKIIYILVQKFPSQMHFLAKFRKKIKGREKKSS